MASNPAIAGVELHAGDCLAYLRSMPDESVHAIVTDPPYGLRFMGKRWDYDVPAIEVWAECLRVLMPGGHLVSFGGSRTSHRIATRIEDAGFELRDTLLWLYSQGMPKSRNSTVWDGVCKCEPLPYSHDRNDMRRMRQDIPNVSSHAPEGEESDVFAAMQWAIARGGMETPCSERPGGVDTGECGELSRENERREQPGMAGRDNVHAPQRELQADQIREVPGTICANGDESRLRHGAPALNGDDRGVLLDALGGSSSPRSRSGAQRTAQPRAMADERKSQDGGIWPHCDRCGLPVVSGWGTTLKPAYEPIILARKPFRGSVESNVLAYGTGAINIDGTRVGHADILSQGSRKPGHAFDDDSYEWPGVRGGQHESGRWPANVLLDPEAAEALDQQTGELTSGANPTRRGSNKFADTYGTFAGQSECTPARGKDTGGASRFFPVLPIEAPELERFLYMPKASRSERNAGCEEIEKRPLNWSSGTQSPGTFQSDGTDKSARNSHPTVKPIRVMRWLIRLVTPPGGIVVDPYTGSGTTAIAAILEGMLFRGSEYDPDHPEYIEIARARIAHWAGELAAGRVAHELTVQKAPSRKRIRPLDPRNVANGHSTDLSFRQGPRYDDRPPKPAPAIAGMLQTSFMGEED